MDPFVGEIRLVALNFAPRNWFFCQGQLLPIQQYTALFSLLGVAYGGDGRTTFALPDLRGRAVVGKGQGPGLSAYPQGSIVGTEAVTLTTAQMPAHLHTLSGGTVPVSANNGTQTQPTGNYYAANSVEQYGQAIAAGGQMASTMLAGTTGITGGGNSHENRMPYLALNYIIAYTGIFPQRP
ncbi:tail fiber protein [Hymenobacter sp. BT635]|uniref:Tail fiber protein n=1 Tax=Hymenobacter nitidus TaxID=2880929 RepID=A0ABS8A7Q8_9BACT|nr:tail fiber protein [Hymenobacter nitidus]MCB2376438.1 tail fiber protein [Hymenobacter nitidus]